jgi:metal-dependent amidase/aminoacylase/carboxypeptidase family protein
MLDKYGLITGVIKNGGSKPNIIPDLTELEFYARTPTKSELTVLMEKLDKCFESAAAATGCTVEYLEYQKLYSAKFVLTFLFIALKLNLPLSGDFPKYILSS